ncbi:uncharacterized protein [Euwallacea fornicatus]|uniref:uncharacterized protein n=1 Tax=Euwallacea fornicatus TaxID=995702 RepID=UPI00338DD6A4
MLSAQILDIYKNPINDDSINHLEFRTYLPFIKSFENNDIIEISVNRNDAWVLLCNAALSIKGKLEKEGSGDVKFVNNAAGFFFDSITYELNGIEVEHVKNPGIVSLIRGYLCYNKNDSNRLRAASWSYPDHVTTNTNGSFYMRIPLSHFLGICQDYQVAISGRHNLRLVRSRNDNNCVLITGNDKKDTTFKLTIENIELKVKHIIPNDIIKVKLLKSLKEDRPILIPFRKWELHELPSLNANSTKEIWCVKTTTTVECPRYIIAAFHTNRNNLAMKDITLFDNLNISDIRLFLNGEYYPYERMNLNFTNNDYADVYYNYTEFASSFFNSAERKETLLDFPDFKTHALFVIDCSRRDESIKSSAIDVKVEIETREGIPANTKGYCAIIHDCIIEQLPLTEVVRKIN